MFSLTTAATALSLFAASANAYTSYTTVTGFFLQDDTNTTASGFDYTTTNFGLKSQVYDTDAVFNVNGDKTQWERFENKVVDLNNKAAIGTKYKVLYLGRHGEGYHNVAETYYGTPAWNCYWSELDGNGTSYWKDAAITPNGYAQALIAHNFWVSQIANQKQSLPQGYYSSPMSRCLSTASITFGDLTPTTFSPIVKEYLREGISMHTCDSRSNKTWIHATYPNYQIEAGFTEYDELFKGFEAETSAAQDFRTKIALDSIFSADASKFISITSHSGETASMLRVFGHRTFSLATGAVIPVLIQANLLADTPAASSIVSWSAQATCTVPPITSLAASGCVCPTGTSSSTSSTSTKPASSSATVTGTSSATRTGTISSSTASSSTSSVELTTSTVYTTRVSTVTACPATVTNCPVGKVTTVVDILYTTVCPVSAVATQAASTVSLSIYTVYTTKVSTITACPSTVTNCPVGKVTTTSVPLYTMTTPVTIYATASTSKAVSGAGSSTGSIKATTVTVSSSTTTASSTKSVLTGAAATMVAPGFAAILGAAAFLL